ncbi:glycosyltransferase family 2 protein [Yoonia sp. BS5-3]|uniref:Glycosyltransferase family 2 protein n=1 Tax=Yoonia phaeophyticola TaxID=3137369 RepID=A0ABZ2V4Q3_9RHOB
MISAVLICYNNEAFIAEAIDSAVKQQPAFDQIIIVDDFSGDQTFQIAKEYQSKDDRIQLVQNAANLGPGRARNVGMALVSSPFFCFLDGDDYFDSNASSVMHRALEEHPGAEMCIFEGIAFDPSGKQRRSAAVRAGVYEGLEAKRAPMLNVTFPWNKLYSTNMVRRHKNQFPSGKYEDVPWCYRCIFHADTVVGVSAPIVRYRIHSESTLQRRLDHHFDAFKQWEATLSVFRDAPDVPKEFFAFVQANCFMHLTHILFAGRVPEDREVEFAQRIREIFPSNKALRGMFDGHRYQPLGMRRIRRLRRLLANAPD